MMADLIEPFANLDLKDATIEELVDRLTPLFKGLQINAALVPPRSKFFRTRIVGERIKNVAEIGVPPPQIIKMGRLNEAGQRRGYFSTSRRSAYFEVHPSVYDFVVLSRWVVDTQLVLLHFGYCPRAFSSMTSSRSGEEYPCTAETRNASERNRRIYDYLSSELTKVVQPGSEWEYKVSNAIARKVFGDGPHDGLLYPTIAMRANADNVALRAEAVSKLFLHSIEFNRVTGTANGKIDVDLLDSATSWDSSGAITWSGRRLNWPVGPGETAIARVEDEEWVVCREDGKEIWPQ